MLTDQTHNSNDVNSGTAGCVNKQQFAYRFSFCENYAH